MNVKSRPNRMTKATLFTSVGILQLFWNMDNIASIMNLKILHITQEFCLLASCPQIPHGEYQKNNCYSVLILIVLPLTFSLDKLYNKVKRKANLLWS